MASNMFGDINVPGLDLGLPDYSSLGYTIPTQTSTPLAYINAQKIGMQVMGMIPSTRLTVFFDSVNVTKLCSPGLPVIDIDSRSIDTEFQETGAIGEAITTNANGMAVAIFHVPENTFTIGNKNIAMFNYTTDSDSYEEKYANNSCHAFTSFASAGYSEQPDVTILSTAPLTQGCSANSISGRTGGAIDYSTQPLCQSFYVGTDMADNQEGIFINSIDLYFSARSNTQPVSIEIRR
jgi:hypothetical protein